LTNVASALLDEPAIASRLTVLWIGGHLDVTAAETLVEYNTSIDVAAAQVVFNHTHVPLWQVPRETYSQVLASRAELASRMHPLGALGAHLFERIGRTIEKFGSLGWQFGEAYVLGDSPLVLLSALRSAYDNETSSCSWAEGPRPALLDSGRFVADAHGEAARTYTHLDTRLLLEDLYAKLAHHAASVSN
jgi:hypothetical protein